MQKRDHAAIRRDVLVAGDGTVHSVHANKEVIFQSRPEQMGFYLLKWKFSNFSKEKLTHVYANIRGEVYYSNLAKDVQHHL